MGNRGGVEKDSMHHGGEARAPRTRARSLTSDQSKVTSPFSRVAISRIVVVIAEWKCIRTMEYLLGVYTDR